VRSGRGAGACRLAVVAGDRVGAGHDATAGRGPSERGCASGRALVADAAVATGVGMTAATLSTKVGNNPKLMNRLKRVTPPVPFVGMS
jgi:hypothetical protein